MKDVNGVEVNIGDKAVVLTGSDKGCVGTVRAVGRVMGCERARVLAGPDESPTVCSWVAETEIEVQP